MIKRILFLVVIVAFDTVSKSTAQDIEPVPLPGPVTSGPLTTSTTSTATETNENASTTLEDVDDTSPSSEYSVTTQTETIPDGESTTQGITTTTENAYSETTREDITEATTDTYESTSEITSSTIENPEDPTTEAVKTSTEDNKTTASIPEESTSTVQTSTEDNTTIGPTTAPTPIVPTITTTSPPTKRPFDKGGNARSPFICRLHLQDGDAYYNWIFRVIVVPKECFFCCRIGYFGLEQCTQINPFFCSC